ncbi:MAG: hypothetical protein ACYC2T_01750 [Bacillota bacterium]
MPSWQPCDKHKDEKKKKKNVCINVNVNINIYGVEHLSSEILDAIKDEMRSLTDELQALSTENNEEEIDDDEELDEDSAPDFIKPKVSTKQLIPSLTIPFDDDDDD